MCRGWHSGEVPGSSAFLVPKEVSGPKALKNLSRRTINLEKLTSLKDYWNIFLTPKVFKYLKGDIWKKIKIKTFLREFLYSIKWVLKKKKKHSSACDCIWITVSPMDVEPWNRNSANGTTSFLPHLSSGLASHLFNYQLLLVLPWSLSQTISSSPFTQQLS